MHMAGVYNSGRMFLFNNFGFGKTVENAHVEKFRIDNGRCCPRFYMTNKHWSFAFSLHPFLKFAVGIFSGCIVQQ